MSAALSIAAVAKSGPSSLLAMASRQWSSQSGSVRSLSPNLRSAHSKHILPALLKTSPLFLRANRSGGLMKSSNAAAAAFLTRSRTMSTAATASGSNVEEPIQGSAPAYHRHIVICTGVPSKDWVKKPERSDPYLTSLLTAVRGQEVMVNFVDEASEKPNDKDILPSKGPRHDLVLFPDNVKFKGIRPEAFSDLSRYLAQYPVGTLRPALEKMVDNDNRSVRTELVPGSGETIAIELVTEPSAVLVCIHGSRDCRCGEQGGELYEILKNMVQATGLTNSIKIYGVSHIGGHKYAPNTIMYPSGDWHGRLYEKDSEDAQQILFEALAGGGIAADVRERKAADPIMIEKWRGRIGMTKEEQLKLYQQVLEKQKQRSQIQGQRGEQPQSLFSARGEDLYEEDGLKEQPTAVSVEDNKPVTQTTGATEANNNQKVKIVFETYQKVRTEIDAKVGERILDIVKDKDPSRHDVHQALECTCGGQLECATCHVYIDYPYYARLPPVTDAEEDMLEYAVGRKDTSRLGCQIKIQPEMEGMVVKLPQY